MSVAVAEPIVDPVKEDDDRWHPVMTEGQARHWARYSMFRQPLFHATRSGRDEAIRREGFRIGAQPGSGTIWGKGVYLAFDQATVDIYSWGKSFVLRCMVDVRRPLVLFLEDRKQHWGVRDYIERRAPQDFRDTYRQEVDHDIPRLAVGRALARCGYDSFVIVQEHVSPGAGGNQIAVFDERRVVVIDDPEIEE